MIKLALNTEYTAPLCFTYIANHPRHEFNSSMKGSANQPKIFISYSWSTPQHEQWVLDFAERLSGDGVVVVLDKWDLKEGQDKHIFMEQMVNDASIRKVLVVCDNVYQTKANERTGGVGTETQLISKKVYESTSQEKFIPIIREYDASKKPCIPHYMASRIYIDLSSDEKFEENYQKLIRNLYDKPLIKRPSLGTPPTYVLEEEQVVLKTSHKVAEIQSALLNDRKSANGLISDYLDTVIISLEDFRLSGGSARDFDDRVVETIEKMLPLRNDFIDFVFVVFKYQETIDLEKIHNFFEKLIPFSYRPVDIQSYTDVDYDNYKFFIYELILNFFAILLQLKKYKEVSYFINSQFFYHHPNSNELVYIGVEIFNTYPRSLDEIRNNRLNLHRVSLTADLIKTHSTRSDISFNDIKQADLILYYVTELHGGGYSWFPRTSIYNSRGNIVELFERMVSLQYFEKIKGLFDVQNIQQLKKKIVEYIEKNKDRRRKHSWDYELLPLENVIDQAKIGTIK